MGSTVNVLTGITAYDVISGDVTEDITYVITNSADEVVTEIDTTEEALYTVSLSVKDEADNEATAEFTIEVVGMQFLATNLVANGSFANDMTVDKPEWSTFIQDWGAAPVVTPTHNKEAGTFTLDIAGGGDGSLGNSIIPRWLYYTCSR